MNCPGCGGSLLVVGNRAWCMETSRGDCGHFFPRWPSTRCSGSYPHGNCDPTPKHAAMKVSRRHHSWCANNT